MAGASEEEPIPLRQLAREARALDLPSFVTRFGGAFLVHEGPLEASRRPQQPQATVTYSPSRVLAAARGPDPGGELLVFPVRQTGRSPYPSKITVGRTRNNDIVVPDVSVSKFHAFFKEEDGRWQLHDADSRNGTYIEGKLVSGSRRAEPAVVKSRTKVRFGLIEMWFLGAEELLDLTRGSKSGGPPGGPL